MTAGPTPRRQNYEQFNGFQRNNYEQNDFQQNPLFQRNNYEVTRIAKFGESTPFAAPASVAGHGKLIFERNKLKIKN